ncbi:MAG: discoidin domain-containing protein [Tannerella sp.]|jgi:hypothetical protein|nr:discoidin domain-containing protein [Tannerella sp.]
MNMKKYVFYTIGLCVAAAAFNSCSDMNDMHDKYLRDGEKTYVGRVDSIKTFSGDERVLIQYWITDPRVKSLHVLWNQKRDSIIVPVPEHKPLDVMEVMIGEGNGSIAEGDHTLFFYSHDERGHRSVVFETLINIYGERYQEQLLNRRVTGNEPSDDGTLVINWAGANSNDEVGVEIVYTQQGKTKPDTAYYPDMGSAVTLENVDYTQGVTYRTLYKPTPEALDTFYTSFARINIRRITNVALGKPASGSPANDPAAANQQPSNAVDGVTATSGGRFVSTTAAAPRWIEIDLQGEFTVSGFKTWSGSGSYGYPMSTFELQAWIDGDWVTVHSVAGNSDPLYGADFPPVTAGKIRLTGNIEFRLYEIEVYSIVTY